MSMVPSATSAARDISAKSAAIDKYITLSQTEYDSLLKKMKSASSSNMATLAHIGISCLANSSFTS